MPCVCLALRNALERARNTAYRGQRVQTAAFFRVQQSERVRSQLVCAWYRRIAAGLYLGRVAVGGSGLNTRGPGPGLRKGWQADRAGAKQRYTLNCFGLHGLGKPVTATVRQGRGDLTTTLLLATALLSTRCLFFVVC